MNSPVKARLIFLALSLSLISLICLAVPAPVELGSIDANKISVRQADENSNYIKIGFYGSLTGSASTLGQMGQLGCRLAVAEINNAGGINGKYLRLIEYDDQTNPKTAATIVRKMIEEDTVDAIIGSHTDGNILNTASLTEQAHVLHLGLGTSYTWTNAGYKYLFRVTGNSANYDHTIYSAIKTAGHKRIAIYYCDTLYATAGAEELMKKITADPSMEIVWSMRNQITQTDFTSDFASLKSVNADALILYATSENAGIQLSQLREGNYYSKTVYASEAFANTSTRKDAGSNLYKLTYVCTNHIPDSPADAYTAKEQAFLESFVKAYGTMPTAETAYRGYDAVMILCEVFRTAESMDSEDLRSALLHINNYEGIGGYFDYSDGSGDGLTTCRVITVIDPEHIRILNYFKYIIRSDIPNP